MSKQVSGELILALVFLVGALGVDFLWVRPQQAEIRRLAVRKQTVERQIQNTREQRTAEDAILAYTRGAADSTARRASPGGGELALLESFRNQAGLRRLEVSLDSRKSIPPFERTTYFMSVYGSFTRQIRFLKALETARPLVSVDAFTMDTHQADPKVTMKLDMAVLTPGSKVTP